MTLLADLTNQIFSETIAEYIWIHESGKDISSKAVILPGPATTVPAKLPKWNCDGSLTDQAPGEDGEVILYPQAAFRDPFRDKNILVICDTYYTQAGEPIPTNKRYNAPEIAKEEPWYGIEQEYTLSQKDTNLPSGWPVGGFPEPQSVDNAKMRRIVDALHKYCDYAGININPIDGEVIQCGPTVGISAADHLVATLYILERIAEIFEVVVSYSFDPKPIQGDWNGAAAHIAVETATDLIPGPLNLDRSEATNRVVIAEYIWDDGTGGSIRSTARILPRPVTDPAMLPTWNYQADGENGDQVILCPQAIFKDPFRRGKNILVICDTYTPSGEPTPTNKRYIAAQIFSHPDVAREEPRFWIQQGYFVPRLLLHQDLLGVRYWYMSDIFEVHLECCTYAGITIDRYEEYGPAVGVSAGDELCVVRYIRERIEVIAEVVSIDNSSCRDWNYRFSSKSMRSSGSGSGYKVVKKAIHKFRQRYGEHIVAFGEAANVRVRAALNADPYVVISLMAETTILWRPPTDPIPEIISFFILIGLLIVLVKSAGYT